MPRARGEEPLADEVAVGRFVERGDGADRLVQQIEEVRETLVFAN